MPISIYKRGDIYHYRGTVNGRRLRGTCQTSDRKTALRIASAKEQEAWKGDLDGPDAILTFAEAVEHYKAAARSHRFLNLVANYWKDMLVKQITSGLIRQAAIVLYPTATGATRNRHVIVPTQAVINYAASLELCRHIKVERFEEKYKIKKPVTWEWVQSFMEHANPHLGALCCFMFLTGARISEAIDLRWHEVDLHEAKAIIRQTKIGDERKAHLPPILVTAIANIQSNREPDAKVFKYSTRSTAEPQWEKVWKRAKIERLTFHCCRHGFATSLLHKGVDPITVAKLGGWKSAEHVFQTYGHAMEDDTLANRLVDTPMTQGNKNRSNRKVKSIR
ncbi:site-specific integrase [Rhizobium rhizogenes]|uniref:tyrosine-type recombinase/integrase n=1 Tax=Rhizobium rhizogenes TaxID=359 RepID=UPI00226EF1F8|nr:site-specific integrase [Rhizobium rhizogenes]